MAINLPSVRNNRGELSPIHAYPCYLNDPISDLKPFHAYKHAQRARSQSYRRLLKTLIGLFFSTRGKGKTAGGPGIGTTLSTERSLLQIHAVSACTLVVLRSV